MGYRSDLYAKVHGSDLIRFNAVLVEHKLEDCFEQTSEVDEDGFAKFTATSLKWYDTYLDVADVNRIFNESEHSVMVRVGEEARDIEYYGDSEATSEAFNIYTVVEF